MKSPNFYEILGVTQGATPDQIRVAFHKLAQEYHPDKHPGDVDASFFATEFRHIHEIYEILINPEQRRQYDDHLKLSSNATSFTQNVPTSNQGKTPEPNHTGTDSFHMSSVPGPETFRHKNSRNRNNDRKAIIALLLVGGFILFLSQWKPAPTSVGTVSSDSTGSSNHTDYRNAIPQYDSPKTQNNTGDVFKSKIDPFADWEKLSLLTGQEPPFCANIQPDYNDTLDNYLKVTVMNNEYDVIIKLVNALTHRCVRAVYIKAGDSYFIKNIPEGTYFVREAYGNDFRKTTQNGQCQLRFISNARYKKLNKILDYNMERYEDSNYIHTRIPSFELDVGIISNIENDSDLVEGNSESEEDFDQ